MFVTYTHALKSAAANIGAGGLSEAAKSLESAGRKQDGGYISAHTDDFLKRLKRVTDDISSFLSARVREVGLGVLSDTAPEIGEKMKRLKTALTEIDIGEIDRLTAELGGYLPSEISRKILVADYKGAVEMIGEALF
jgi:HPt (histidine-containing phosphotransfer) domain-containing protein